MGPAVVQTAGVLVGRRLGGRRLAHEADEVSRGASHASSGPFIQDAGVRAGRDGVEHRRYGEVAIFRARGLDLWSIDGRRRRVGGCSAFVGRRAAGLTRPSRH